MDGRVVYLREKNKLIKEDLPHQFVLTLFFRGVCKRRGDCVHGASTCKGQQRTTSVFLYSLPPHCLEAGLSQNLTNPFGSHLSSSLSYNAKVTTATVHSFLCECLRVRVQSSCMDRHCSYWLRHLSILPYISNLWNFHFPIWMEMFILTVCLILSYTIMAVNANCVYWYKPEIFAFFKKLGKQFLDLM